MQNVRVALAGNPNSGKTTLFNLLTGARQRVGNYPGVTVERKEGTARMGDIQLEVLDLPGCYSLTAYSPEERVARKMLVEERPNVVVQVADATTLERSLYLSLQFMELGLPMVLALNMMDELPRKGMTIDTARLSEALGVPVVEMVARVGRGKTELVREAASHASDSPAKPLEMSFGPDLDMALQEMSAVVAENGIMKGQAPARWVALKLLEADEEVQRVCATTNPRAWETLQEMVDKVTNHCQATLNSTPEVLIADYRYGYISSLLKGIVQQDADAARESRMEFSQRLDKILTHRLLGPVIMLGVLYGAFELTFAVGEIPMGWLETLFGAMGGFVESAMPEGLLRSLILAGVIDGVGGVLGFVPLIAVMFMVISFLEDAGYMARVAYMLDRVFRAFGLHGCSVMPFLVSGGLPGGCAVPGVMATRTLRSPKEKLATLLTAPFMVCGAKVPVFLMLAAAFFPGHGAAVMFWTTLAAWGLALLMARAVRSTVLRGDSTPFIMELPPYRLPTFRGVMIHTWERAWQYIKKAGTVILAISVLLWAAMTFPGLPEQDVQQFEQMREQATTLPEDAQAERLEEIGNLESQDALRHSIAGRIGTTLEPLSQLAGFDWRTNIALVGGVAAKEVIVSTMGTAYSLGEVDPEEDEGLVQKIASDPAWNVGAALACMIFVLLYAPCFVTIVTMAKESTWKWALFSTTVNTGLAFVLAVGVYQISKLVL